jgi:hypothetical protein
MTDVRVSPESAEKIYFRIENSHFECVLEKNTSRVKESYRPVQEEKLKELLEYKDL